ncbi:MAG TPA: hypothetical protein VFF71_00415 [Luteimonas sp.]|nr:hypothetical protein [Luteimonas sp.]
MTSRVCPWHKAFSLVRFFDAYQRNELGRAAGETPLILPWLTCLAGMRTKSHTCKSQKLSPSATSFLLMSVKRNGSKEKRFVSRANPAIH